MAYSRTLEELELAVRREADMVNSDFVKSDEVRLYINESWAQLYDRIVMFDQEYLLRHADITSTGAGEYDLSVVAPTCVARNIVSIKDPGTAYAVGDTLQLYLSPIGPTPLPLATATAVVTSVDPVTQGVTGVSLSYGGDGYKITSASNELECATTTNGLGADCVLSVYFESNFYKCKGIWYQAGSSGFWNPLRRFQWEEQNLLRQTGIYEASRTLPLYRMAGIEGRDKLLIAPDTLGGTYRVWYYPAPPKMLSSTDRIDGRAGWDDWVVKDVAIRCLLKEESVEQAAAIKAIRDEIWARFQLHAANADASQPERIRDVRLLSRRYGYWR